MRFVSLVMALVSLGCVSATVESPPPVWPPLGVDSPRELVWRSQVTTLRSKSMSGFLRFATGLEPRADHRTLRSPIGVAVSDDALAIVESTHNGVWICDLDGSGAHLLALPAEVRPISVAFDKGGQKIFVADRHGLGIWVFERNGTSIHEGLAAGIVVQCGGMTVARNGDMLLTDTVENRVVRVNASGEVVATVGQSGSGPGEFSFPAAIQEAPDGSIWVIDTFNFRLQELTDDLQPKSMFGTHGDGTGQFALPKGLAISAEGYLLVADARFDVIQIFDRSGRLLLIVGGPGGGSGYFTNVAGLALGNAGILVAADTGNARVQMLEYRRRVAQ